MKVWFSGLPVPITRAPSAIASCTATLPTPPAAPLINSVVPSCTSSRSSARVRLDSCTACAGLFPRHRRRFRSPERQNGELSARPAEPRDIDRTEHLVTDCDASDICTHFIDNSCGVDTRNVRQCDLLPRRGLSRAKRDIDRRDPGGSDCDAHFSPTLWGAQSPLADLESPMLSGYLVRLVSLRRSYSLSRPPKRRRRTTCPAGAVDRRRTAAGDPASDGVGRGCNGQRIRPRPARGGRGS